MVNANLDRVATGRITGQIVNHIVNGQIVRTVLRRAVTPGSTTADTTAPTVPTNVTATSVADASFTVSWTASTDAVGVTGYDVQINGSSYATPVSNTVSVTGRSSSTAYTVRVRSRDAAANFSALSTAITVTTTAPTAAGLTTESSAVLTTESGQALTSESGTNTSGIPVQQAGRWWSDFSSSTAITPASGPPATGAEWSGWGQDDRDTYGIPALVSAASEGIAAPPSGDRVARLRHSGAKSPFGSDYTSGLHNMHKFYKQFTTATWPGGAEPTNRNDGAPSDVSGRYITYLYFRSSQMNFVAGYWSNTVQFKEDYSDTNGQFHSDPSWWLGFNSFNNPASPVFNLSCWGGTHQNGPTKPLSQVMDRWVKFEMRVYQGDRLEAYIDDVLFDVGPQSECPVGRRNIPGVTGSSGGTVQTSLGWTFGVGNYTNGNDYPAGASGVYVDLSTVLPLP